MGSQGRLDFDIGFQADTAGVEAARNAIDGLGSRTEETRKLLGGLGTASKHTGGLLEEMGSRGGSVRRVFMGMQVAMRGGESSIFGAAMAMRGLTAAMAAGLGVIAVVVAAVAVLGVVYAKLIGYYTKLSEESEKSAEALKAFDEKLKEQLNIQNELKLSLDTHARNLEKIKQSYEDGTKAIDDYASAQKELANSQKDIANTGIKITESKALMRHANQPIEQERDKETARHATELNEIETRKQLLSIDKVSREWKKAEAEKNLAKIAVAKGPTGFDEAKQIQDRIDQLVKDREKERAKIKDTSQPDRGVWGSITHKARNAWGFLAGEEPTDKSKKELEKDNAQNEKSTEKIFEINKQIAAAEEDHFKKMDEANEQKLKSKREEQAAKIALDKLDGDELTKIYDQEDALAEIIRLEIQRNKEITNGIDLKARELAIEKSIAAASMDAEHSEQDINDLKKEEESLTKKAKIEWGLVAKPTSRTPYEELQSANEEKKKKGVTLSARKAAIIALSDRILRGEDVTEEDIKHQEMYQRAGKSKGRSRIRSLILDAGGAEHAASDTRQQIKEAGENIGVNIQAIKENTEYLKLLKDATSAS